ncbi:hypothetical protein OG429_40285 (plasmid) [Streptomyces sp. NBC_00190]|uniref:hypothetical protein n=1 Tax=unclassified Streptomyces TaxID=2593676 RepID=UPI002E2AA271|nr:hypothetical protein [Streptomyces sp. NBC_00190]WSZ45795.1 hypothetical protein OG239_44330 [Streptomyces sp. NBC_00868]
MASEQLPKPHASPIGPADGLETTSSAPHRYKICADGRLYKLSVASLPAEFAGPSPKYDGPAPDVMEAVWAREAAVTGDSNAIDRFTARVLVLRQGGQWREAVSTALLGDWALALDTPDGLPYTSAVADLRTEALVLHRQLTPLWRRRTGGSRVLLLDTPLGDGITLYDLIIGSPSTQELALGAEPDDARLRAVLNALSPEERKVALAWARPEVATWTEAAAAAAVAEADSMALGERVRRKLKRLGKLQAERTAASAAYKTEWGLR